ncbi:MAG: glycosyltransferase family 39 protein [Rubrobacter sp.]|nr:glycosyltransferase family 39 protein [Rubrobacter sp.]
MYLLFLLLAGVFTVGGIGITWDEPNYFGSSYLYLSWFGNVFENPSGWWSSIDRFWEQSHEAPPFFKLWALPFAGLGVLFFGAENLEAVGDFYRMASYALFLISISVAFRFVREEFGSAAAWGTAVTIPLMPVLFGFSRLGQLDGAVAAMYIISAVLLFRLMGGEGGKRRTIWTGVVFGMAFATKLNVFPVVLAAILWAAIFRRRRDVFVRICASFGIGAAAFFAIWPWLWRDPIPRTLDFLTWTSGLQNERLMYYLGEWWAGAPFHYPLAALIVFVPLVVAVAGVVGAAKLVKTAGSPASAFLLINLALILAVAGSGLTPVYGGPRQFLAAFPLWAMCAGVGFAWISARLRVGRLRINLAAAIAVYAALALPGIIWTGTDNSLEYYGEAVGLVPGANALGFETTYLANTYKPAVEWVNQNAPEGATVYVQAGTYPVAESYSRTGELREDLRPAYLAPIAVETFTSDEEPRENSYFFFLPRQSIYTEQMLALEEMEPLYEDSKGGVPLVRVYSGEAVGETLDIEGGPEARDVGAVNAAVVGMGLVTLFSTIVRRKEHEDEEGEEHEVPRR